MVRGALQAALTGLLLVAVGPLPPALAHVPIHFAPPQTTKQSFRQDGWRLTIRTSRFSGDSRCHLEHRQQPISYAAGALGFHFSPRLNTQGAWLKIDDAPPSRAQDETPALIRLGVPLDGPGLDNPGGGVVWIPASRLNGASIVTIQPAANRPPRSFSLKGFVQIRELALARGCTPEGRFE